jgi:hypothetical protein
VKCVNNLPDELVWCRAQITSYTLEANSLVPRRCANHLSRGGTKWKYDCGAEQKESSWHWHNDQIFIEWSTLCGLKNSTL